MSTFRLYIPAVWNSAAIDSLRAAYIRVAMHLAEHVEDRAGNTPAEWAPRARARLDDLGGALDQIGWDRRAKHRRVTRLETSGATIGIAVAGILKEVARYDLSGEQPMAADDPNLLVNGRERALIAMLRSVRAIDDRS